MIVRLGSQPAYFLPHHGSAGLVFSCGCIFSLAITSVSNTCGNCKRLISETFFSHGLNLPASQFASHNHMKALYILNLVLRATGLCLLLTVPFTL